MASAAAERGRGLPGRAGRGRSPWVCTATFGTCASSPHGSRPPGGPPSAALRPGPAAAGGPGAPGRRRAGARAGARPGDAPQAARGADPQTAAGGLADAARGAGSSRLTDTPRLRRPPPPRAAHAPSPTSPRPAACRAGCPIRAPRRAPPEARSQPGGDLRAWRAAKPHVPTGFAGAGPCAPCASPRRRRCALWGL